MSLDRDHRLCLTASYYVADRQNIPRTFVRILDVPERSLDTPDDRRIELLVEVGTLRIALEHTLIESYPDQKGEGKRCEAFVARVQELLPAPLPPGSFTLALARDSVDGLVGVKHIAAAAKVAKSVSSAAIELADDDGRGRRLLQIEDFGEAGLWFLPGNEAQPLRFSRAMPNGLEAERIDRLFRAFRKKLPKLALWRDDGFRTCLVLEDQDMALANPDVILEAAKRSLEGFGASEPDFILVAETAIDTPWWWTLYEEGTFVGIDDGHAQIPIADGC